MIACQLVYNIYDSFFSFNLVSECRRPQYKANKGDNTVMAAVSSKGTVFTPKGFFKNRNNHPKYNNNECYECHC